MTRNLRTQVVDLAEHALRSWFGDDISREDAALALPGWRFVGGLDDELRAEVLSRFPASEPPSVPGLDFLAVEQDAQAIVAETPAEPKRYRDCDGVIWTEQPWEGGSVLAREAQDGYVMRRTFESAEAFFGPLVEVTS